MGAYVLEIQGSTMLTTYHSEAEIQSGVANQDFYTKCSYASVSQVPMHTIILMSENGNIEKKETFFHPPVDEVESEL